MRLREPRHRRLTIPLLVVLWIAYGVLTLAGGLLLRWPATWREESGVTWGQAILTALSAVCTAGFASGDLATTWNAGGLAIVLALVELGGLLYVATVTLLLATVIRRTTVYEAHHVLGLRLGEEQLAELVPLLRRLVLATLAIQAVGALTLLPAAVRMREGVAAVTGWSLFTAVMAFHNVGFDLEPGLNGFSVYQRNVWVILPVSLLALLGAFGFPVLSDLVTRRSWRRLYPETRLVFVTAAVLLIGGTVAIAVLEANNPATLGGLAWPERLLDAFATVATRTGGPRVLDTRMLGEETSFLLGALTFIGGASGSIAGGVKLQTFTLLLLAIIATVRGSQRVIAFGREVPEQLVYRALAIAVFSLSITFAGTLLAAVWLPYDLPVLWLLVVQAFGLAGEESELFVSLGTSGQSLLACLMVLGRFGPLMIALMFATRVPRETVHYARESVRLG